MTAAPVVYADGVRFQYPHAEKPVGPFDLGIAPGGLTVVHGPSGCGKSTLVRLLCGVIPHLYRGPMEGAVRLGATATTDLPLPAITARVGAVFQNPEAQMLRATVAEEIDFGLAHAGWSAADRTRRRTEMLGAHGLEGLADRDPRRLSGGEQQRVVLAAVTARRPEVLLLDEPLSMLDVASTSSLIGQLAALRSAGTGVAVFEHRRAPFADATEAQRIELPALPTPPPPTPLPPLSDRLEVRIDGMRVWRGGREILRDVSLGLVGGEAVALQGPNGSGKTTLLRVLSGLQDFEGNMGVRLGGRAVHSAVGLCFQNPDHQLFNPSVRSELRYANAGIDEQHYGATLDLLGLRPYEQRPPLLLSEGEKKRLAIGILLMRRGLAGLCLDEPTLGQDAVQRQHLGRIVRRLVDAGYLCVVATHDEEWARRWCDRKFRIRGAYVEEAAL